MGGARGKVVLFVLGIWNNALSAPSSMTGISAPLTFSRSLGRSSTDISLPRACHDFHVFQRQTTAERSPDLWNTIMPAVKERACTILGEFTRAQTELVGKAVILTVNRPGIAGGSNS